MTRQRRQFARASNIVQIRVISVFHHAMVDGREMCCKAGENEQSGSMSSCFVSVSGLGQFYRDLRSRDALAGRVHLYCTIDVDGRRFELAKVRLYHWNLAYDPEDPLWSIDVMRPYAQSFVKLEHISHCALFMRHPTAGYGRELYYVQALDEQL